MRTIRNIFPKLCDPDHLDQAADDTVDGKRRHPDVAWFLFCRDAELARIQHELATETYRPARPELLGIRDPKPRLIARVPVADRVVHTALVKVLEPAFLPSLLPDAYACREDFGNHRAVLRLLEMTRRHRFAVHLDVRSYFPSVDLDILAGLLYQRVCDPRVMSLVHRILESGAGLYRSPAARSLAGLDGDWPPRDRGLPIGSYTSQVFAAHVYLNDFDHFVKRDLKVPGYLRYVDDLFLFGDRRADLRSWRRDVADWLWERRGLRLKHPQARILSCGGHLNGLGYRITRAGVVALPRALQRLRRRIEVEVLRPQGSRGRAYLERSVASSAGIVLF